MKKLFSLLVIGVQAFAINAQTPYGIYSEGLIGDINANGWIKEYLHRQTTGMTGYPESMSYPYNSCLWAGEISRNTEVYGSDWWRYEQTAYYTDGLLRLGYILNDKKYIDKGEEGIRYTLDNATPAGVLGNKHIESMWPMCVYFRVMQAYYEYTQDENIPKILEKHYLNFTVEEIEKWRNIVSIEGMLWTYGKTGNKELLRRCELAYNGGKFGDLTPETASNDNRLFMHGVTCMEELKLPMLLYGFTGNQYYMNLALNAERKLVRDHMLPDGVPASAEALVGNDNVINSHEACDIVDYTWTLGHFLQINGDAKWADKIEKAVFNAGLGTITKDFKSLQYFSSVNQVIATGNSNHNEFFHGSTWMAYRPTHETECCAGNIHRLMPNYISRMWMEGKDGEIVAALYGPSDITFTLKNGKKCKITEETNYPFDENVTFTFDLNEKSEIPFTFRIPEWCDKAEVFVNNKKWKGDTNNGEFVTINRTFKKGDKVILRFEMKPTIKEVPNQGVYLQYGPLLYSYAVPQTKVEDKLVYENMNGKIPGNDNFKCWSMQPVGSWNYALCADAESKAKVVINKQEKGLYPFDLENSPVKISVPVKKIDWNLQENRYTPTLPNPNSVKAISEKVEYIELVPYGSTELRLTVFPTIK